MDGTLLTNAKTVTAKTAAAVHEFQKNGGLFVINTGRDFDSASASVKAAGIDCDYVCLSGASVHEADGKCVKCDTIDREELMLIRAAEKKYGLYGLYLGSSGKFASCSRACAAAHYVNEARILACDRGENPDNVTEKQFARILDNVEYDADVDAMLERGEKVYKIAILGMDMERLMKAKEELRSRERLNIASSDRTNVEVNSSRVDKGLTAAEYAKEKGILPSEIMVIGDSENDIAMLRYPFGRRVAMGNAEESIKALCTDVTLSNEKDGVAYALEQWALK